MGNKKPDSTPCQQKKIHTERINLPQSKQCTESIPPLQESQCLVDVRPTVAAWLLYLVLFIGATEWRYCEEWWSRCAAVVGADVNSMYTSKKRCPVLCSTMMKKLFTSTKRALRWWFTWTKPRWMTELWVISQGEWKFASLWMSFLHYMNHAKGISH